ncbi:hypothetical protein Golax_017119, partial [Gossypium laxum]|nr:hypothetical protein [Gossypium laxum]
APGRRVITTPSIWLRKDDGSELYGKKLGRKIGGGTLGGSKGLQWTQDVEDTPIEELDRKKRLRTNRYDLRPSKQRFIFEKWWILEDSYEGEIRRLWEGSRGDVPDRLVAFSEDDCIFFGEASDRGSYAMNGILKECEFWSSKKFGVSSIKGALFFRSGKVFRAPKCGGKGGKNKALHEGIHQSPHGTASFIQSYISELEMSNRSGSGIVCRNCVGEVLGSKMVVKNCVQTLFAVEALECLQAVLTGLGLGLRHQKEDYRETNWLTWMEEYRDRRVYSGIRQKNITSTGVVIGNGGNGKEKKGIWKIDQLDEEYNHQKGVLVSKIDVLPNGRGDDSIQWLVLDN